MANINISIAAEPIFHLGSISITNSIFTSWIITILLLILSLWASKNVRFTKKPKGLQNVLEMIIEALYNLTLGITESTKKSKAIFPFVLSFFLFIILNNWFGLLPGVGTIGFWEKEHVEIEAMTPVVTETSTPVTEESHQLETTESTEHKIFVPYFRAGTSDLNTTAALAFVSCFMTWVYGFKFLGFKGYTAKFKNPLELISEISRLISFTFRLFGNIFAGEVLLVVMSSLIPIIVPSVFYGLELFVGAIQAFVFSILTLAFMNLAMESHGGEAHKELA